jgi:hypothetical protein
VQHGLRQFGARGLIEDRGEPLLGADRFFTGMRITAGQRRRVAADFVRACLPFFAGTWFLGSESDPLIVNESTVRASSARSSAERMMVCVHCTRKPFREELPRHEHRACRR